MKISLRKSWWWLAPLVVIPATIWTYQLAGEREGRLTPSVATERSSEQSTEFQRWLFPRRDLPGEWPQAIERAIREVESVAGDSPVKIQSKMDALDLIGGLKHEKAIPLLIREIDFRGIIYSSLQRAPDERFPCVRTLARFGKTATAPTRAALKDIGSSAKGDFQSIYILPYEEIEIDNALLRVYLLTKVLKHVEGTDRAKALIANELQPDNSEDPNSLRTALQILERERHY